MHANTPADALARLETLVLLGGVALPLAAVRAQLVAAVDAIVQVARGATGRRCVVAVAEIATARGPRWAGGAARCCAATGDELVAPWTPPRGRPGEPASTSEEAWQSCRHSPSH